MQRFVTIMRHYYGRKGFVLGQLLYNMSLQANNIASMIVCSTVMDSFIAAFLGKSVAVDYACWPPQ